MRITAITQQKRDPSRYNIFIDGVYAFALPMQDILYFKYKHSFLLLLYQVPQAIKLLQAHVLLPATFQGTQESLQTPVYSHISYSSLPDSPLSTH